MKMGVLELSGSSSMDVPPGVKGLRSLDFEGRGRITVGVGSGSLGGQPSGFGDES